MRMFLRIEMITWKVQTFKKLKPFLLLLLPAISHLLCLVKALRRESQPPKLILGIFALVWVQKWRGSQPGLLQTCGLWHNIVNQHNVKLPVFFNWPISGSNVSHTIILEPLKSGTFNFTAAQVTYKASEDAPDPQVNSLNCFVVLVVLVVAAQRLFIP